MSTTTANGGAKLAAPRALRMTIYGLELATIAVIYVGLATTAILVPAISTVESPLWPPTGVALAFILLRGYRIWPAIFIGSFCGSAISLGLWTVQPPAVALGTTVAALIGAKLINHWSYGTKTFVAPLGIVRFVIIAFLPTAMIAAASAMTGQLAAGVSDYASLAVTATAWWLADAVASVIIAPVIVLWGTPALQAAAKS